MHLSKPISIDPNEACAILGVAEDAGPEQLRAAYLEQVRLHPPDREPEVFEKTRDAYEQLRDPRRRARQVLAGGPDPSLPLTGILDAVSTRRRFVGPGPWLNVLKEKRT